MSLKTNGLIVVVAIIAMSGGFWMSSLQQDSIDLDANAAREKALAAARKNFSSIQGAIISPPRKIAVPELIKDDGSVFTLDDLKGEWHLLFFGYMNCPDVCPVTMGVVAQAKKMAAAEQQDFPGVIFISVDPDRDKVEALADYVQYFDKDFIGVTGDKRLLKALSLQMSVVFMKMAAEDGADSNNYLVDHSSALLLLNPQGKLVAFFNPPHDANIIRKDFQTMLKLSR